MPSDQTIPGADGLAVTKSDATTYDPPIRFLWVGTGGDIQITTLKGNTLLISNVQDGSIVPFAATKVWSTNTTASDIVAGY